jgi:gliding motility-associated-like protein
MKVLIIFILFSTIGIVKAISQGNYIECIQTDLSGNLIINWSQSSNNSNSFISYDVMSIENGAEANVNSISTLSTTITSPNQLLNFYIKTNYSLETTLYSDTFSNIFLTLNNPSNGTAVLQWNNPSPKPINNYYHIYREYPTGNWSFLDSLPYGSYSYTDTINICSSNLNYQIRLKNNNCEFTSNVVGSNFTDIISPDIPQFTSISYDTLNGNISINWNINKQNDTYGYIIYEVDENGFSTELDTIYGRMNTNYSYTPSVNNSGLTYTVAAFDSCFANGSTTIFQTSAKGEFNSSIYGSSELDICSQEITLTWTEYNGWETSEYIVYVKSEDGVWSVLDTTNYRQYKYFGESKKNYTFVIEALSLNGSKAFSNLIPVYVITPTAPNINDIEVVTVNDNSIELKHLIELTNGVKELSFQRLNEKGEFKEFERIIPTTSRNTIIDNTIDINRNFYSYQVVVIDSCYHNGDTSNRSNSIFLEYKTDNDRMTNYLSWNPYHSFEGSLLEYQIYRGFDGIFDGIPFTSVNNTQHYFEDEIETINYSGKICYYVEAIESKNIYGVSERSKSNLICPSFDPIIYIPNAFTPNGDDYNAVFTPVISIAEMNSYSLEIFNRWEQVIFESDDYSYGWDGKIKNSNNDAPQGIYLFQLKVNDGSGVQHVKRGMLNLIR